MQYRVSSLGNELRAAALSVADRLYLSLIKLLTREDEDLKFGCEYKIKS